MPKCVTQEGWREQGGAYGHEDDDRIDGPLDDAKRKPDLCDDHSDLAAGNHSDADSKRVGAAEG